MQSNYRIVVKQKRQSKREYPYREIPGYYDIVHKVTNIGLPSPSDMPRSMGEARALRRIMDGSGWGQR